LGTNTIATETKSPKPLYNKDLELLFLNGGGAGI